MALLVVVWCVVEEEADLVEAWEEVRQEWEAEVALLEEDEVVTFLQGKYISYILFYLYKFLCFCN